MEPDVVARERRNGTIAGLFCYVFWGLCPIYWKLLGEASSLEVIAHRIIWCFVLVVAICIITKKDLIGLFKSKRAWKYLFPAALFVSVNWGLYIYAVDTNRVIETAIGYYINPIVSILLGIGFFKERLSRLQIIAVSICAFGILFFTCNYGKFPWIAVTLAVTFGIYGAIKKKGGYPPAPALAFENTVALPFALALAFAIPALTGSHCFMADVHSVHGWVLTLLLIGGGPVTAIPLLLFATAANKVPLTTIGFLQYVSPSIALLVGVFLYGEPFTLAHAVCFACIWTGLALVGVDSVRRARAAKAPRPSRPPTGSRGSASSSPSRPPTSSKNTRSRSSV